MWLHVPYTGLPSALVQEGSSWVSDWLSTISDPDTGWWVQSRGTPKRRPASWRGWRTRPWIGLLCGTTSPRSTAGRGVDEWISSVPASPVSRSPKPESAVELTMTDGSGRWSPGSSLTWDRDSCSWRTSPDLFGTVSLTSSPTLPTSGSMRNGSCSPRPTAVPPTAGNASGSWPTATGMDAKASGNGRQALEAGWNGTLTDRAVRQWQTPTAADAMGGHLSRGGKRSGEMLLRGQATRQWPTLRARDEKGPGYDDTLPAAATRQWPTPRASHNENRTTRDAPSHGNGHGRTLAGTAAQQFGPPDPTTGTAGSDGSPRAVLNPPFVETLMGWPTGWTDCTRSATESFHSWRQRHSSALRAVLGSTSGGS